MSCNTSREIFCKTATEELVYTFNFEDELETGDTISSVVHTELVTSDLTFSDEASSTPTTQLLISGGVAGTRYLIQAQVISGLGLTHEIVGTLDVE